MARKRRRDRHKMGRSKRIPYKAGESYRERHERRKKQNLHEEHNLRVWCEGLGVILNIHNEGHHWQFHLPSRRLVEWWPSSAKCVVDKRWSNEWHCHDTHQVKQIVANEVAKDGECE